MPNLAVVGSQWGDEGKGKVVDLLAPAFSHVARYQGGPNAGHTVVFDGASHALHHIPSAIFHDGVRSLIGAGAVVDPVRILEEIDGLEAEGVPVKDRLRVSSRSHVILPVHRALDGAQEIRRRDEAIGTTKRGIGPVYAAKAERWGLRLGELGEADRLQERLERIYQDALAGRLEGLDQHPTAEETVRQAHGWWQVLGPICEDVTRILHEALETGESILFEGAQGALLDVDHGTYPFVTSSSTVSGGIPAGLGIPPRAVERVLGVMKAYTTRVGAGPFPTEQSGGVGDHLREAGREYGTTTGRPRRCGWFDAVAGRYAVRVNGLDALALTKFDVLSGLDQVRIATAYELDGERTEHPPALSEDWERVSPVYETMPGWTLPDAVSGVQDLPRPARAYLDRIAELTGSEIAMVSVGPDRRETLLVAPHLVPGLDRTGA
jgi:adenylosuccinate synthase